MDDIIRAAVKSAMEDDLFKSMNFAAIRARAGRLEPGETLLLGGYDFLLAEDEEGTGYVVMIVLSRQYIENFAIDKMEGAGIRFEDKALLRTEFFQKFFEELRRNLQKFQQIRIRFGPGDDLTFEKAVYTRDLRKWR
ncbi:MAG: hypothetical protein LUQ47_05345 [Methanotrichaceae archaeon]|nr:hypothetical protein [Methanotrichaceae archaeon]